MTKHRYRTTQGKIPIYELYDDRDRRIGQSHDLERAKHRAKNHIDTHPKIGHVDILKWVGRIY